jgi:hypothetical protein
LECQDGGVVSHVQIVVLVEIELGTSTLRPAGDEDPSRGPAILGQANQGCGAAVGGEETDAAVGCELKSRGGYAARCVPWDQPEGLDVADGCDGGCESGEEGGEEGRGVHYGRLLRWFMGKIGWFVAVRSEEILAGVGGLYTLLSRHWGPSCYLSPIHQIIKKPELDLLCRDQVLSEQSL